MHRQTAGKVDNLARARGDRKVRRDFSRADPDAETAFRPILNAGAAPNTMVPATTPDPEVQRLAQQKEAARVSRLFAQTGQRPQGVAPVVEPVAEGMDVAANPTPQVDAGSAQNMQDRKSTFLNVATDKRTVSPNRLQAKASPYVVQAGTVIPAALMAGIRSDLPGQITAQVTEAVYGSPTGRYLLIPQGAKPIGQYDSSVAFGQSRLLLVWNRLIMPDGASIVLERQPGADAGGYAGLEDEGRQPLGHAVRGGCALDVAERWCGVRHELGRKQPGEGNPFGRV
jgi:type IV secretion system protein TrbI